MLSKTSVKLSETDSASVKVKVWGPGRGRRRRLWTLTTWGLQKWGAAAQDHWLGSPSVTATEDGLRLHSLCVA